MVCLKNFENTYFENWFERVSLIRGMKSLLPAKKCVIAWSKAFLKLCLKAICYFNMFNVLLAESSF